MNDNKFDSVLLIGFIFFSLVMVAVAAVAQETTTTEEVVVDNQVIRVMITTAEDKSLRAVFEELTPAAQEIGLQNVVLKGDITQEAQQPNGNTDLGITWTRLGLKDTDAVTDIEKPLSSNVIVNPNIGNGDVVGVQGDFQSIVDAYYALLNDAEYGGAGTDEEEASNEEEEEEAMQASNETATTGYASAVDEDTASESWAPEFTGEKDEAYRYTSTQGCSIRIDTLAMEAHQQARVMEDGVEVSACSDSGTVYALTKSYSECPVQEDFSNKTATKQYTLGYIKDDTDPQRITATSCTTDSDTTVDMESENCGIQHNYTDGVSTQQVEWFYVMDGVRKPAQSCANNDDVTYTHQKSAEGCSANVTDGMYVPSKFTYITVDNVDVTIQECTPDTDSATALEFENCTSPAYTHDTENDVSHQNVNYYVEDPDTAERTYIPGSQCVQGQTSYVHQFDTAGCSPIHDDVNKRSTIRAMRYFELADSTRVNVTGSCEDTEVVDYVESGTGATTVSLGQQTVYARFAGGKLDLECGSSNSTPLGMWADPPTVYFNSSRSGDVVDYGSVLVSGDAGYGGCNAYKNNVSTSCRYVPFTCTNHSANPGLIACVDMKQDSIHPKYLRIDSTEYVDTSVVTGTETHCRQ